MAEYVSVSVDPVMKLWLLGESRNPVDEETLRRDLAAALDTLSVPETERMLRKNIYIWRAYGDRVDALLARLIRDYLQERAPEVCERTLRKALGGETL